MTAYKIAFVNPYLTSAEVQAFESLRAAAQAMDISVFHKAPKDLSEDDDYDFLIAVGFTPKTTSHPTFMSVHSPRQVYVESPEMLANVMSHDGYLTISENLARFFTYMSAALGKRLSEVGVYYNCPQISAVRSDIGQAVQRGELGLCYFGINWDMRAEPLFKALSQKDYVRIYGPADSWRTIRPAAYKGQLPFDGVSVQKEYARFGAGLVCMGYDHLLDDIISNRVFEISSVGAAAISPSTPWMRRHFGDTVFYYDPFGSIEAIVDQIEAGFSEIQANPQLAQEKADAARAIFEKRFHAGAMLANAVDFFERWKAAAPPPPPEPDADIDIVLLLGKDADEAACGTLRSIARQTCGRFRGIVVGAPADRAPLETVCGGALTGLTFVEPAGASRGAALACGLSHLAVPYFAVCDAGDLFLADHFSGLLAAARDAGPKSFAYADVLAERSGDLAIWKDGPAIGGVEAVLDRIPLNSFLADRALAAQVRCAHWDMQGSADRTLVAALIADARPAHKAGATCVRAARAEVHDADALEEQLAAAIEIAPRRAAIESRFADKAVRPIDLLAPAIVDIVEHRLDLIAPERVFEGGMVGREVADRPDIVHFEIPLEPDRIASAGVLEMGADGVVRVQPQAPFEISLRVDIADYVLEDCSPSVVFVLEAANETFFLGMADSEGELIARTLAPRSRQALQVWVNNPSGRTPHQAVLQAWNRLPDGPFGLKRLILAYRKADLARALGRDSAGLSSREIVKLIGERTRRATLNVPDEPLTLEPIDIRSPKSAYPGFLRDEKFAQGAGRVVSSGHKEWGYMALIHLSAAQLSAAKRLRLNLTGTHEGLLVMLLDANQTGVIGRRFEVPGRKDEVEVWLDAQDATGEGYVLLQSKDRPQNLPVTIRGLSAAY